MIDRMLGAMAGDAFASLGGPEAAGDAGNMSMASDEALATDKFMALRRRVERRRREVAEKLAQNAAAEADAADPAGSAARRAALEEAAASPSAQLREMPRLEALFGKSASYRDAVAEEKERLDRSLPTGFDGRVLALDGMKTTEQMSEEGLESGEDNGEDDDGDDDDASDGGEQQQPAAVEAAPAELTPEELEDLEVRKMMRAAEAATLDEIG
jgi:hypothetical protein